MRLYFARADLLLHQNEAGEYVLEQSGERLATFKSEKKAKAEYDKIRKYLEDKFPSAEVTDADRKALLERYLADNLLQHNSLRDAPRKKPAKSRTFG
jgi:hypothetical protein